MVDCKIFFTNLFSLANKASVIAQTIRKETSLFDLLIENKTTTEFLNVDFKTFADVLIQETVRHNLNRLNSKLGCKLLGEETNKFTNKLNASIEVNIGNNISLTKELIMLIVDSHEELADRLSEIIHSSLDEFIGLDFDKINIFSGKTIDLENIEMRIDPIDSTKEYVNGLGLDGCDSTVYECDSIKNSTVLIGAYNKTTGIPFAGVICQPFHSCDAVGLWTHSCYWGIHFDSISLYSDNIKKRNFSLPGKIITSYREVDDLTLNLNSVGNTKNWEVIGRYGAGFKLLSLITSEMDCCIVTKASTYKWDTCGPHGILLSIGGGIVDYQKIIREMEIFFTSVHLTTDIDNYIRELLFISQIQYNIYEFSNCNTGGFLAYTNPETAISIIKYLFHFYI